MATIFPGSASVGQIFEGYLFNGTAWDLIGNEFNPTTFSPNAPYNPKAGDLWVDSDSNVPSISNETILTIASASATYLTKTSASTTYATKAELSNIDLSSASAAAVAAIVDSAPSTLNTLNELAAALGDDENFATTVTTALGNKLDSSSASTTYATKSSPTFTGTVVIPTLDLTNPLTTQDGGTGLSSIGSAGYVLKVNSGANALEWGAIAGAVYQDSAPTSPQNGDIWIDSNASASLLNTNDFLLKNEASSTYLTSASMQTVPVYVMNSGSSAQRPVSPSAGMFRFNTDSGYPEWYDSITSNWYNFYQQKTLPVSVNFLVIAGGGGGGNDDTFTFNGGGGGAGGLRSTVTATGGGGSLETGFVPTAGVTYTITVGAGGASNSPGSNSSISTIGITSTGGGRGKGTNTSADGGSGGGGHEISTAGGSGTANQGFGGGARNGPANRAGGGGGAGAVGAAGNTSGNGGAGVASDITGSSVTYAGGGGAGGNGVSGSGGAGGGGNGGNQVAGTAATVNTGGGGGGAGAAASADAGGAGGSGVVILSYPSYYIISIGAGLTGTTATVGANKVTTFTAGTGTVSFA